MFDLMNTGRENLLDFSLFRKLVEPPNFPVHSMGRAGDYLQSAADGSRVPVDYVASVLLAAVGAIGGKRFVVRVNNDWYEPVITWSAMIGPPSSGKTPAIRPVLSHLQEIQNERIRAYEKGDNADLPMQTSAEAQDIHEATSGPSRLLVNDSTVEALAKVEAQSPDGMLVVRDELSGLIESLERYSRGGDRAYYLEAWQCGGFSIDRVRAGSILIQNHLFAVFGGIQPDRLRSLLVKSGDDDGFAARLLLFWPDPVPPGPVPLGSDHGQMKLALDKLERFLRSYQEQRILLTLTADSYLEFSYWYEHIDGPRMGQDGKIGSALGKMKGQLLRLAGHLHLLDWAFSEANQFSSDINAQTMQRAVALVETYFVEQVHRLYKGTSLSNPELIARDIVLQARERGLSRINIRDARRTWGIGGAHKKDAVQNFRAAASILVEGGWLSPLNDGRGSLDFDTHPLLRDESFDIF